MTTNRGMTDPSDALASMQAALAQDAIALEPGALDHSIGLHVDAPNGRPRFNYVRLENGVATALAMFATMQPYDGAPCFQTGYAVASAYRGQGRAEALLKDAIAEMRTGLARANITRFFIEAVVGKDNLASQRIAERVLSSSPRAIVDQVSQLPALHFLHEIKP